MMDWNSIVDQFEPMTCVISVEKTEDGGYGRICIVTGNRSYLDSLALAAGGVDLDSDKKAEFVPNSEYTRYIPKDLNFEDVCYRCAVLKQPMQNIVHMARYPFDIKAFLIPMHHEEGDLCFCTYSQVLIPKTEGNLMSKHISLATAMEVIGTCIKLRGSSHFHDNMGEVIEDIRVMCGADNCCALLMDEKTRTCSVLGEAKSHDSPLPWMRNLIDDRFYDMAETWLDVIGGSFCLAITDKKDMEYVRGKSPEWYESLTGSGVETLVIFPIISGDHLFGYIWATNFNTENTEHIKDTLELTSAFIASELSSDRFAEQEAEEKSRIDRMGHIITGLHDDMNRHLSHLNDLANRMITAMASDYRSVYYVDLDRNDAVCYRSDPSDNDQSPQGLHFPYIERFTWYANNFVTEGYREGFLNFIEPENIRKVLSDQPIAAYRYLADNGDHEYYEMIRIAGVRRAEDRVDNIIHAIGLGFTDIDSEMREAMAKNEALVEALHVAEEASRAKTAFLSNMSHEIRTPMNAIIGLDRLALSEEDISGRTRDYLEKIGDSASHLLGLINDILDMSRIESGHVDLRSEEFPFKEMLEQINSMVMSQCGDKGLTYECRILSHVDDYYVGDDMKLKEVLINILSNAIKFTEAPGSITMTVERTAVYEDQSTLKFCIRDTGIGMDKDYIPKIFDTFSQEDSGRTNKYGSTGLGMAISKGIVEMMNGSIHVESEKGVGSEFTVLVTLHNSTRQMGEAAADTAGPSEEKKQAELAGRRILLAEDIDINAEIMMDVLSMEDMETEHAENGRIAVEMFSESAPGYYSAILMDVRMPEMDGLEASVKIRALNRKDAKLIPIIALTANAFDEDVQRSMQAGMNSHLSKPVDPEVLFRTLGELIYEAERKTEGK